MALSTEAICNDLHGFIKNQKMHHKAYRNFTKGVVVKIIKMPLIITPKLLNSIRNWLAYINRCTAKSKTRCYCRLE